MNEIINGLNKLMNDFYSHWERENTNEMFLLFNGSNDTQEIEVSVQKNNRRLEAIEEIINEPENFETLTENWDSIDLKMLDSLVATFEIDISEFIERVNSTDVRQDIKEFFTED